MTPSLLPRTSTINRACNCWCLFFLRGLRPGRAGELRGELRGDESASNSSISTCSSRPVFVGCRNRTNATTSWVVNAKSSSIRMWTASSSASGFSVSSACTRAAFSRSDFCFFTLSRSLEAGGQESCSESSSDLRDLFDLPAPKRFVKDRFRERDRLNEDWEATSSSSPNVSSGPRGSFCNSPSFSASRSFRSFSFRAFNSSSCSTHFLLLRWFVRVRRAPSRSCSCKAPSRIRCSTISRATGSNARRESSSCEPTSRITRSSCKQSRNASMPKIEIEGKWAFVHLRSLPVIKSSSSP
mmetsp:Transcript_8533/g.24260  ORF Transcript_8533/g.24260 Transcript_8533/m.24260 type:complete len:298 (+) Transcript_8533:2159-3052(+)